MIAFSSIFFQWNRLQNISILYCVYPRVSICLSKYKKDRYPSRTPSSAEVDFVIFEILEFPCSFGEKFVFHSIRITNNPMNTQIGAILKLPDRLRKSWKSSW